MQEPLQFLFFSFQSGGVLADDSISIFGFIEQRAGESSIHAKLGRLKESPARRLGPHSILICLARKESKKGRKKEEEEIKSFSLSLTVRRGPHLVCSV